ncbi:WD40 repeat domain-containing protein [Streptomyces sp. 900116325]
MTDPTQHTPTSTPENAPDISRLTDPAFLVHADPDVTGHLLDRASSAGELLAAAVYRASTHLHRYADSAARRNLLALDAARYGDRELAARIAAVSVVGETGGWGVAWATGSQVDARLRQTLTGHTGWVTAVAIMDMKGRPYIVTGADNTVRIWDPATGDQVGEPLTGHDGPVWSVAAVDMNGRPYIVTGADDMTARIWDPATGEQVGKPLTGHTGAVNAVATVDMNGRPHIVTGSDDMTARIWDPATGEQVGKPLTGHGGVWSVATVDMNGRPHIVTGGRDKTVRIWDPTTGEQVGGELVFPAPVTTLAAIATKSFIVGFGHDIALLTHL